MAINISDLVKSNTTISEDTSPTLGGNLDTSGFSIENSLGPVNIDGLNYPLSDGPNGATIFTDGSGNLSLSTEAPIYQSEKAAAFGVATLNSFGKIPDSQMPPIALTDVFVVSSEVQMLALLSAQTGDIAIRTDANITYILSGSDPTVLSNWVELLDRPDLVTSVFGRTGDITAQYGDYAATLLSYSNTISGLVATNVQAAIDEVETRVDTVENIAGTAIQPGDNISVLINDSGYITNIIAESIGDLSDVDIIGVSIGQFLRWNGSSFVYHSLVKNDITDFNDGDYATFAQGALADSAIQPGDNISTLTNDSGYISNITAESIGDLIDVDNTGVLINDVLVWNGLSYVPTDPTVVGPVSSVFGRTGEVTAQTGDYDAIQIDYDNSTSGLNATNSQAAIDEIEGRFTSVEASYIPSSEKGSANGVATLNAFGLIPNSQIPPLAISETFVVNSQSAMVALSSAEIGDVAVRTDENKSYILAGTDYSLLGDWQELLTPTDTVLSVNGQTGAVVLGADDIDDSSTTNKFTTSENLSKLAGIQTGAQLNTVSNIGTGEGVYSQKVGSDLQFKSLLTSSTLSLSSTADSVTISPSPVVFSAHNGNVVQNIDASSSVILLFNTQIISNTNYTYNAGIVTINSNGMYDITFELSASGSPWICSLYKNSNVVTGSDFYVRETTLGSPQTGSCSIIINLVNGDMIWVGLFSVSGTVTTENSGRFNIRKLS